MKKDFRQQPGRRDLLAAALRYASFTLLAGIGATALAKRQGHLRHARCTNMQMCRQCALFESCTLRPALSAKRSKTGTGDG